MAATSAELSARGELRNGWSVLVGAMLGCGLGVSSLPLYTAGVFMPALETEFGWTRAQLSTAVLVFSLALAAASPVVGRLIDRIGVRRSAAASIVAAATCYWLLSSSLSGLEGFYAAHIAIPVLGAAAAPVAYTRIVALHFTKMRGLAMGITLLGPSLAAATAPAIIAGAIGKSGWQGGYLTLAGLMLLMLPFLLLLRETDGHSPSMAASTSSVEVSLYSAGESRRIFLTLLLALGLFSLGIGGPIVHLVPLLVDSGMTAIDAAAIAGLIGVSGIVGRLAGGALADRMFAPYILVTVALLASAGCAMLATLGVMAAAPTAVVIGLSLGAEADMMGYLVSRYFPRRNYGRVFGWQYAAFISCVGLSPLMLGFSHDLYGTYRIGLGVCALLLVASAGVFVSLPGFRDVGAPTSQRTRS